MRKCALFLAAACGFLLSGAQTQVARFNPGSTAEGVTYALPRTRLRVKAEAMKTTYTPGEFARYAERYLHMGSVATEARTEYRLLRLSVGAEGVADTAKMYSVRLKGKTVAPLVTLDETGILLAINGGEDLRKAAPAPRGASARGTNRLDARQYLTEDILAATSSAKMAELTAAEIYDIRESKNAIMRGQVDAMPKDGESLRIVLGQLDRQEKALLQLFVGFTDTLELEKDFELVPAGDVERQVLFRFSTKLGFVDADDLSGAPYYISVQDRHSVPVPDAASVARRKLEGIVYNLPGSAAVVLSDGYGTMLEQSVAVAQFGTVDVLPGTLFNKDSSVKVTFSPATGGIVRLEQ